MKIDLALDSGAFTLYTKYIRHKGAVGGNDFSYFTSEAFEKFKQKYMEWMKENHACVEFCVTLDVIFNPQMSYDIWRDMQAEAAKYNIPIMPVVHNGEGVEWLRKYIDHGCGYIGLGGMGKKVTYEMYRNWIGGMFKYAPKDIKLHGFAVTSPRALTGNIRWYSVDSASPFWWSANGMVAALGSVRNDRIFRFDCDRRKGQNHHITKIGGEERKVLEKWLTSLDLTLDSIAGSSREQYVSRSVANYMCVRRIADAHGIKYYLSGSQAGGDSIDTLLIKLEKHVPSFSYLGSFLKMDKRSFGGVRQFKEQKQHANPLKRTQAGRTSSSFKGLRSSADTSVLRPKPRGGFQR